MLSSRILAVHPLRPRATDRCRVVGLAVAAEARQEDAAALEVIVEVAVEASGGVAAALAAGAEASAVTAAAVADAADSAETAAADAAVAALAGAAEAVVALVVVVAAGVELAGSFLGTAMGGARALPLTSWSLSSLAECAEVPELPSNHTRAFLPARFLDRECAHVSRWLMLIDCLLAWLCCRRMPGVFVSRGKEDALVTKNLAPGTTVYGEKTVKVDQEDGQKIEYRVWNPFRSKLAAAILGGVGSIWMGPGTKVMYLGAASGTSVSHVSDLVGPTGLVYAVEFSHRSGRDLINMAKARPNIVPIIEDARHPLKYRMLVSMVDCVFADVAQPDQSRIVALNSHYFLKPGGHCVISIKANCIDSTAKPEAVFAMERERLKAEDFKPLEQLTLEPYERDHAVLVAVYRPNAPKVEA